MGTLLYEVLIVIACSLALCLSFFLFYGVADWTHGPMHARDMLCYWSHLGMKKLFLHYALISEEVSEIVISDSGLCLLGKFVTKVTMWHLATASAFVLASVLWELVLELGRMRQLTPVLVRNSHVSVGAFIISFPNAQHITLYRGFTRWDTVSLGYLCQ